jgi:hypothetical protein
MKRIAPLFTLFFFSSIILLSQENGGPYVADESTVLLMHFEDDATNAAAVGNSGIAHGTGVSYETSDGGHGKVLRLDNSTFDQHSWIEIPFYDDLNFTEEFSIECWFKLNSWGENPTGNRSLFKKEWQDGMHEYEVILNSEAKSYQANLDCIDDNDGAWGADAGSADILELNKWYHLAMYYNHAHKHLYCLVRDENYEEIYASRSYSETSPVNGDGNLMIGYGGWNVSGFDGWIDEFRISKVYRKYRDDVLKDVDPGSFKDSLFIPLKDKWTVYQWPLGEYYPTYNNTGEINRANACGPTMLMRTIHYWEHPRFPSGVIEHDMENCDWSADYNNTEYLWDQMPEGFPPGTSEEEYAPAATFSAQVGTASMKFFDSMYAMPKFLKENFLFSKKTRVLFEEEYTREEWENIFKNELNNGRPIMIGGVAERTAYGGSGHYYICNGYNSKDEFFTDYSFNDNFWSPLHAFDYGIAQDIIIFLEPDWGNKILEIDAPEDHANILKGSDYEIKWTSEDLNNVMLEYSADGGENWLSISESEDASAGSHIWSVPSTIADDYKIRISDIENLNVYSHTGTFSVYDQKQLGFEYPALGTKLQGGSSQPVYWQSSGINGFKLEYSLGQDQWEVLCDSLVAKNGSIECDFPAIGASNVILKATDLEDELISFQSEAFSLVSGPQWGGPYTTDDQTLLLMHFEEDLKNASNTALFPVEGTPSGYYLENYKNHMGKAFRFDNSDGTPITHNVWIDNSEDLDLGTNWTMEAWVKVISVMGEKTVGGIIMDKWDAFGFNVGFNHFNGFVKFENGTNVEFWHPEEYDLNRWYHVAMISDVTAEELSFLVHDSNADLVYRDTKSFPAGSNGNIVVNENLLKVGGLGGGSNMEFDGYMDEVRISKKVIDFTPSTTGISEGIIPYKRIDLSCYPNPVTSESMLFFETRESGKITISIFEMNGSKVQTILHEVLPQGVHSVPLGQMIQKSGMFICRLESPEGVSTIKLVVSR